VFDRATKGILEELDRGWTERDRVGPGFIEDRRWQSTGPGREAGEDRGAGQRVVEGAMRGRGQDPVVRRKPLERIGRGRGHEHRRKLRGVQALRPGREAVPLEEGEIEADVVPDEGRLAREGREPTDRVRDGRRADEVLVLDAGEPRDRRADVAARIDERAEPLARLDAVRRQSNAYRADLDDPIRLRIEPRRLQVDRDELLQVVADLGRTG